MSEQKRPIDYTEIIDPESDDYLLTDSTTYGTRKIKTNNYIDAGGITQIFDLRSGDTLRRSSFVKSGNIVFMSVVIMLGSDIVQYDELLKFKSSLPANLGKIKPSYVFDVICSYGNNVRSLTYTDEQITGTGYTVDAESFFSPVSAASTENTALRFQTSWAVE